MITPEFCRQMARYNAWQNKAIWQVVEDLPKEEFDRDRGAFFGSIRKTLNHLLWGDQIWLSRFSEVDPPANGITESGDLTPTRAVWWAERFRTDGQITLWAEKVSALDLVGDLEWYSGAVGRQMRLPKALCVTHFFNHQTHHRGQVHAMLTAAGATSYTTDLALMPGETG